MSFSEKTKNELARIILKDRCCQMAELAGLVRMDGTILISSKNQIGLELTTENAAVARKILRLAKLVFNVETELRVQRKARLKKNNIYLVKIPPQNKVQEILRTLGITREGFLINPEVSSLITKKKCCRRSYLRGVFLGAGSVNDPENTYHLEIATTSEEYAQSLVALIKKFGLDPKISTRKNWQVVYLKESEQIVTFLNVIEAHTALLNFESTRIQKGIRNKVNRLVNCETANLTKTIDAAFRQKENIELIAQNLGLENLPLGLRQVAELRLEQPDISLKELGELTDPPLGKSGINHRIRKLEKIAENIRNQNKKK
ncbi:MAG: sporulation regulator WhiA [Clostridiaceae bacterium BRH_c20a]|nr:MAG: sporulation regulator WhiA [Clostridiaceae bacterium BRH_c20a]